MYPTWNIWVSNSLCIHSNVCWQWKEQHLFKPQTKYVPPDVLAEYSYQPHVQCLRRVNDLKGGAWEADILNPQAFSAQGFRCPQVFSWIGWSFLDWASTLPWLDSERNLVSDTRALASVTVQHHQWKGSRVFSQSKIYCLSSVSSLLSLSSSGLDISFKSLKSQNLG